MREAERVNFAAIGGAGIGVTIYAAIRPDGKTVMGRIDLAGTCSHRYPSVCFLVVVEPLHSHPALLPKAQRCVLVAVGTVLLSLLALAVVLQPDSRGFGTHERLGLPPCSFRQLTGYRCPSCGMTTAWAHLVRGRIVEAFRDNVGGALLGLVSLMLAPWSLLSGWRGRWLWGVIQPQVVLAVVWLLVAVTLIDWSVRFFLAT